MKKKKKIQIKSFISNCCESPPTFELDYACFTEQAGYCSECGRGAMFKRIHQGHFSI